MSRASRRAISVLPTPVGPIMMMFLGATSSREVGARAWRRRRFRSAMATARLAVLADDVLVQLLDDLLGGEGVLEAVQRGPGSVWIIVPPG